jgi:uncharacterized damage-inducible protein DinB
MKETFVAHAAYNRWMNQRLYGAAAELDDRERKRDLGAFFKSIHGTLAHLLLADRAWLARLTGDPAVGRSFDSAGNEIAVTGLDHVLYDDFADLRREREKTDAALIDWIDSLDDAKLDADVSYRTMAGAPQQHPLWWAVSHVFNHQTHHRGQVTTLLKQLGRDPGVTDLIAFLRSPKS